MHWVYVTIVLLCFQSPTFAQSEAGGNNKETRDVHFFSQGIDIPSAHWQRILDLSEITKMTDETYWDFSDDDLRAKWKEFLKNHQEALDAYQRLNPTPRKETRRSLLETTSLTPTELEAENWMSTWMKSFATLIKDNLNSNHAESSTVVDTLRSLGLSDSANPELAADTADLFRSLLKELTQQPAERAEPTDVWDRMEQTMKEVEDLQRRALLSKSIIEAFESYGNCRNSQNLNTVVNCLKNLTDTLQRLLDDFSSDTYTSQELRSEDSSLLNSFRADIASAITHYQQCQELEGVRRIACLADWWRSILEMEKKYANLDESALSTADAHRLELLKRMLSLQSYIPGSNPEIPDSGATGERSTLSELISSALNRNNNAESMQKEDPSSGINRIVSRLRDFIGRLSVFSRLGFSSSGDVPVRRRLLSQSQDRSPVAAYEGDLRVITDRIRSVLQRRDQWTNDQAASTLSTLLRNLMETRQAQGETRSTESSTLETDVGRRIALLILERIRNRPSEEESSVGGVLRDFLQQRLEERQSRMLLMEDPRRQQFHMQAREANQTIDPNLGLLPQAFKEKASDSLKSLGEVKAMVRRRLHQAETNQLKDYLQNIQPHISTLMQSQNSHNRRLQESPSGALKKTLDKHEKEKTGPGVQSANELVNRLFNEAQGNRDADREDSYSDLRMLDVLLRQEIKTGLSEILRDATDTTRNLFQATTGIIAHDLHDRMKRNGMPHEKIELMHLPNSSYEVLSEVGGTIASLSDLQTAIKDYSNAQKSENRPPFLESEKKNSKKKAESMRQLLEVYPGQSGPTKMSASVDENKIDETIDGIDIEILYPEDFDIFGDEVSDISASSGDLLMNILVPQLDGVTSEDLTNPYALENPSWWMERSLYIPETQHLAYDFDFEATDESAPVHQGLGALMKYYLLQDIRENRKHEVSTDDVRFDFIIFCLGLIIGLFLAFISIGVILLKKELRKAAETKETFLSDTEAKYASTFGNRMEFQSSPYLNSSSAKIKASQSDLQ